jgi:nitrate/TMAO reductase-like tetraheme cytochrome c subunit
MADTQNSDLQRRPGFFRRIWVRLRSPSPTWSVLALVIVGVVVGGGSVIFAQVVATQSESDAFCGGACHSMQRITQEYAKGAHYANRAGMRVACHDCHIPHDYPAALWYKAKAGTRDMIAEMQGVIDTTEQLHHERARLADAVWAEYRESDSTNCRHCHLFTPEIVARQTPAAKTMHQRSLAKESTCIDCHKGLDHAAPGG